MGTYFALMDDAAKRGEDYELLERIPDILRNIENGLATPDEVSKVIDVLDEFEDRISALIKQDAPAKTVDQATGQVQVALKRLESLKQAIQFAAKSSLSAAHT